MIEIQFLIAHHPREILAVQLFVELGIANLHKPKPLQTLADVGGDYELVQQVAIQRVPPPFPLIPGTACCEVARLDVSLVDPLFHPAQIVRLR